MWPRRSGSVRWLRDVVGQHVKRIGYRVLDHLEGVVDRLRIDEVGNHVDCHVGVGSQPSRVANRVAQAVRGRTRESGRWRVEQRGAVDRAGDETAAVGLREIDDLQSASKSAGVVGQHVEHEGGRRLRHFEAVVVGDRIDRLNLADVILDFTRLSCTARSQVPFVSIAEPEHRIADIGSGRNREVDRIRPFEETIVDDDLLARIAERSVAVEVTPTLEVTARNVTRRDRGLQRAGSAGVQVADKADAVVVRSARAIVAVCVERGGAVRFTIHGRAEVETGDDAMDRTAFTLEDGIAAGGIAVVEVGALPKSIPVIDDPAVTVTVWKPSSGAVWTQPGSNASRTTNVPGKGTSILYVPSGPLRPAGSLMPIRLSLFKSR